MERRDFLKALGAGMAGAALLDLFSPKDLFAKEAEGKEFFGVLVDTTRCIGCRSCEVACAEAHGLPVPEVGDESIFRTLRKPSATQWTVVNRYRTEKGDVFVKTQCMHCCQPACVAACLVKAMQKHPEGHVTWAKNCMGCRLCMFSCPFDIPKFEYDSPTPTIQKCNLCWDRYKKGEIPACVEACPQEALLFGPRRDLLEEARARIYQHPDRYYHHIYGEHEVGGTSFLYLSPVPFEQIGFRTDLGTKPYPEYTTGFLYAVPFVFVLWPSILLGMGMATKREEED
ncbi:MAG: 4Fe-4S dicluster domain-containing protein [Deltaproteobacteria bacterium]|nr:MAG: 4Fe-4S dicluster domain-containing protein [Deltaproteobacteria bacterium]